MATPAKFNLTIRTAGNEAALELLMATTRERTRSKAVTMAIAVNGVDDDELAAAATYLAAQADPLAIVGHAEYAERPTLARFLEALRPGVPVAACTRAHWIAALKDSATGDVLVADSGAWFSRKSKAWNGEAARRRVTNAITVEFTSPRTATAAAPSKPLPVAQAECESCGVALERAPTGRKAKFCSTACRMAAYRKRLAA